MRILDGHEDFDGHEEDFDGQKDEEGSYRMMLAMWRMRSRRMMRMTPTPFVCTLLAVHLTLAVTKAAQPHGPGSATGVSRHLRVSLYNDSPCNLIL